MLNMLGANMPSKNNIQEWINQIVAAILATSDKPMRGTIETYKSLVNDFRTEETKKQEEERIKRDEFIEYWKKLQENDKGGISAHD